MTVTVNTDASFSIEHKFGAYAFWIKCDAGTWTRSGPLRTAVTGPEEAEFQCIINALFFLSRLKIKNINKIVLNADSMMCINCVQKGHKVKKILPHLPKYRFIESTNGFKIEMRHVEAHAGTNTKRKYVNNWCDKAAKKALREEVKKLKNIGTK